MEPAVIPFDLPRLFLGDAPIGFYAEIVFRSVIIYLWTLTMLRLIGGRTLAQLSLVEFMLVIALGSAVGDAMFYPKVPLFHALTVVTVIVLTSKGIDMLTLRFMTVQDAVDGQPVAVVVAGRVLSDGLSQLSMSTAELRAQLRLQGVANLGQVRAAYLEPGGKLSVFLAEDPRPGLRIEPPCELLPLPPFAEAPGRMACCAQCGDVAGAQPPQTCSHCAADAWAAAEVPAPLPGAGKAGR